ncbi:MAG: hypothetical protein QGG40_15385, partial [Myxococcota bacterium]|nr:hypothetical protein [Myxococcota bacterium]
TVDLEEDLGGPESLVGTVVSQAVVPRKAASAKGESTAFWSRGKIADMLTEDEDEPMRGAWSPTTEDPTVPLAVPPGVESYEERSTDIGDPADFDEQPTQVGVPAFPAGPPGAPDSFGDRPTSVGAPLAPQPPAPDATMRPTQLPGMPGFIQPGPQDVVDHTLQPRPSSWVDPGSTPFGAPQAQATGVMPGVAPVVGAGPSVAPPAPPGAQAPFPPPGAAPPMTPASMPPVTTGAAFGQVPAPAYPPQYPNQAPAQGGSGRGLILGGLGLLGVALIAAVAYIVVGSGGTSGGEIVEVVGSAEEPDAAGDQASATDSGGARDPEPQEEAVPERTQRVRPPSRKSSSSRSASSTPRSSSRPAAAPESPPEPTPAPSAGTGQLQARVDTNGQKTTLRCNPPPSIGQSVEFVGNQLLSFDSESTCVIKMSGGRGILAVKQSGTYVCREDGGAVSCGIGR